MTSRGSLVNAVRDVLDGAEPADMEAVAQWLQALDVPADHIAQARPQALVWALERGSRSGRVAWQFAKDFAGRHSVGASTHP